MTENLELAKHHFELAFAALNRNDFIEAEKQLRLADYLAPNRASILSNLSAVLIHQKNWAEAKDLCIRLLRIEPNNVEGNINLGICKQNANDLDGALIHFDLAIKEDPSSGLALTNKGNVLLEMGELSQARTCLEESLLLNAHLEETYIGLGNLYNELQDYQVALQYIAKALELNPNNHQAKWNKSLSLLRLGRYEEGWELYESRWRIPGMMEHQKHQDLPLWLGQSTLNGKTILIHAEQGYGDAIQMSRYLPILTKKLGAKVIFEAPPPLIELMQSLGHQIQILSAKNHAAEQSKHQYDFQCPIMSLPLAFKTTLATIPQQTPYLSPDQKKCAFWRNHLDRLSNKNSRLRVGICWSGSGHYAGKKNSKRDIPSSEIFNLIGSLEFEFIEFHSLQKDLKEYEYSTKPNNLFIHQGLLESFADTAALIEHLDIVISIDTAAAHLAGALNKKTLLLLPSPPDFMYGSTGTVTPWYPNVQIIRQNERNMWPIEKVKAAILNCITYKN